MLTKKDIKLIKYSLNNLKSEYDEEYKNNYEAYKNGNKVAFSNMKFYAKKPKDINILLLKLED